MGRITQIKPDTATFAVEWWPISRVTPYPNNARVIPRSAVEKVASSIRAFGWRQPIVVDTDGVVVAGHVRWMAAQSMALAQVPVHVAHDLTPGQVKAYRLMDNRSHDEATWNLDLIGPELKSITELDVDFDLELAGFDQQELNAYLYPPAEASAEEDSVPELPVEPVTRPGDLWLCSSHRLLCGDARTAQLEYEERAGKLIPAERAAEYAATFSAIVKDGLMAMPDRLSPILAAVDDEKAIHRILVGEVSAALHKVSKAVADAGL